MKRELQAKVLEYIHARARKQKRMWVVVASGMIVAAATALSLMSPAVTMTTICGEEAHSHTAECFTLLERNASRQIRCDVAESGAIVVHHHDICCYGEDGHLICSLPEISEHVHSEACWSEETVFSCAEAALSGAFSHIHGELCFDAEGALICPLPEREAHRHGDNCYSEESVLICGQPESAGHIHLERCFENAREAICGLEESENGHRHQEICFESPRTPVCGQDHFHLESCFADPRRAVCGQAEGEGAHAHGEDCFAQEQRLVCALAETVPHVHSEACPEIRRDLICGKEEILVHTHTADCANEACGCAAVIEHQHTESCIFQPERIRELVLTCEVPEHRHTTECYPGEEADPDEARFHEMDLQEDPDAEVMVRLTAETRSGAVLTVIGPVESFPCEADVLTLSVCEIDPDEDIISEDSVYGRLRYDMGLSAMELWEKKIRIFSVSLQNDGAETYLTGPVAVTIAGVEYAAPTVYIDAGEEQFWEEADGVFQTDEGTIRFEAERLSLFGVETGMTRRAIRRMTPLRSEGEKPDTLTVYKVWTDGIGAHTTDEIEVGLLFDDGINDPILEDVQTLSAATNWSYTFTLQHSMEDNGRLQYSVIEDVPGYQTQYGTITRTPMPDSLQGWWVPASSIEDGGTYVFVSTYNGSTYTPAGHYDMDTSAPSYMSALPVDIVSSPITINGIQYSEYLENVDDAASFTAVAQSGGGFVVQNRWTQRYMDVRGYCPLNITTYSTLNFVNNRVRAYSSNRWLKLNQVTGGFDYTQATSESAATVFSLYKLIPGESANAFEMTITNKRINPQEGTDSPEIHKTIDWLGDDGNNTDTALRGDEFYRLYLDVRALTNSQPVDLLLVLDNSGSMFTITQDALIDGRLRNDILLEILYDLIPDFLAANPDNRISHLYFSGPVGPAYNSPASVPANDTAGNVANDAWLTQEWTQNAEDALNNLMYQCKFVYDSSGGGTNYAQGLALARSQIDKSLAAGRIPYVLFLSDGVPTYFVQSTGQRGGNGFDTIGRSVQSSYYNVAKRNVDNCRQHTLTSVAAFKADYPMITVSAVGFSSLAQEGYVSIMSQMPLNDGFYQHATNTASLREALTAAFAAATTSNVTITDELSSYVQIPTAAGANADYKVTMTEIETGAVTTLYQDGAITPAGQGIVQTVEYTAGNGTDSTGTVQLKFVENYVLDHDYKYTLSYNVEVTSAAYEAFENNGYDVGGDAGSDHSGTGNESSEGKPGFHSNKIAYINYLMNGEEHTDYFAHPVVQVHDETVNLVISKSVISGDLEADFPFEILFRDGDGNLLTNLPESDDYVVDNAAGKITFTLKHGQSVAVNGLPKDTTAEIREISHDGYTVLIKEGNQTLFEDDNGAIILTADREITVVNNAGLVLPETGGVGVCFYSVSGVAVMLVAFIWISMEKRKGRDKV